MGIDEHDHETSLCHLKRVPNGGFVDIKWLIGRSGRIWNYNSFDERTK